MNDCEMEKAIPFSYCLGFLTFSVPLEVLESITKQSLQSSTGNCVRVAGLLFGNKGGTDIYVKQSLKLNCNKRKEIFILIEDFCQKTKTEFLGFYSNGQIPDEEDVDNLQTVIKTKESSIFLLKFHQSNQDDLSTVFECVLDSSDKGIERIYFVEAHSTPECGNSLIDEPEPSKEKKIFYIGFEFTLYDQLTRLEKLDLPEDIKSGMFDKRINMHPNYKEHLMTLHKIAVAEDLPIQSLMDYMFKNKKPEDFDCVKVLKDLCKKGRIDVTYNFDVELKRSGQKMVTCCIKILDDFISSGSQVKIKDSCVHSTCSELLAFTIKPKSLYARI